MSANLSSHQPLTVVKKISQSKIVNQNLLSHQNKAVLKSKNLNALK